MTEDRIHPTIYLDPQAAAAATAARRKHLNTVRFPLLRLLGSALLVLTVALHNRLILEQTDSEPILKLAVVAFSYALVSWWILRAFYGKTRRLDLGVLFLVGDLPIWTAAIYFSGAEASWLFFVLILRVADQVHTTFPRALVFCHAAAASYAGMLIWLASQGTTPVDWPTGLTKLLLIYTSGLYLAMVSRPADAIRHRLHSAIRVARESIQRLEAQSVELKAARDEAEASNRAKSQFLANVSHELRTPLNAVIGLSELLVEEGTPRGRRDHLWTIHQSSEALLVLIDDLLDLSRIESGRLEMKAASFSLSECTETACSLLRAQAAAKSLDFSCEVDSEGPDRFRGDAARIRQILLNLIGNAVKFTSTGSVRVRATSVVAERGRADLTFSITDTGPGIPPHRVDELFSPFSQLDSSPTRSRGGVGLGLAISRRLAEIMGGQVWVESELGRGSTFFVSLPCEVVTESAAEDGNRTEETPRAIGDAVVRAHILVAEDNVVNQEVIRQQLQSLGHQVELAANGQEALGKLRELSYDVIIMDMQMPVMDGLEATRRLRSDTTIRPRPWIIALTAGAQEEDRTRCMEAGMDDYLAKPVRLTELGEVIQRGLLARGDRPRLS